MIIEKHKLSELHPSPYNPRQISKEELKKLEDSMAKFGYVDPLIWNKRTGNIVGGHQRFKILSEKLPLDADVEVSVVDLDEYQEKALNLALNKISGEWEDTKLDELLKQLHDEQPDIMKYTGFDEREITRLLKLNQPPNEDIIEVGAYERAKSLSKIQRGDIFQLDNHRLMCGDATSETDINTLMDGQKANMVFTDPPYGVSYAGKNEFLNTISRGNRIQIEIENDQKKVDDLAESVIYPSFCQIKRVLAPDGSYYITAPQGGELLMMMMMMRAGLTLRHMLIWVKNNHVLGRTDYNYKHEPILYGWIDKHNFYGLGEHQFSTWEIDKPHVSDLHPTMKPIALITNALLNSSRENELIIDFFGGSGSTLIACEQTNRICYMIEIDPIYVQIIIDRWEKLTNKKAVKL